MELEEAAEEEEWETTSTSQYLSKPNANSGCMFKSGLRLGKKILVAGFVASAAPFVVPPLFVASAIGLTVSMPYALFLASHTCTQSLMSRLLPMPTPQPHDHQLLDDMCFQPDIDIAYKSKEEHVLKDEVKRDNNGIVDVNEENMALRNDYEEGVVKEEEEDSSPRKDDDGMEGYLSGDSNVEQSISGGHGNEIEFGVTTVVLEECQDEEPSLQKDDDEKLGDEIYGGMEGHLSGVSNEKEPISGGHGDEIGFGVTTVVLEECQDEEPSLQKDDDEKLGDKIYGGMEGHLSGESNEEQPISVSHGNEIEEFGVTTIVLEECEDGVKEGDRDEEELQRETKGMLEKIRDEGRTDMRGEYVEEIHRGTNESDQSIGPVVENREVPQEDIQSLETEGKVRNEEDFKVCEERVQSRNGDESDDKDAGSIICNEAESGEPLRGILDLLEVDSSNDSKKPTAETCDSELLDGRGFQCETILVESIGDMLIETQVINISVAEDTSQITNDKTDAQKAFEEEPEPTILQKGKSDDNMSDFVNQEALLNEHNIVMDSSDVDPREIADESGLNLCHENTIDPGVYSFTIDLNKESSNVMSDLHTDSMEVLVSSVEQESRSSECSSEKNVISPSEEALFIEGDIWKQIHAIRKIIGYEGTSQTSCADELKALYVFTGVEPPTFVKENPFDPAEINEKLHFLMSIVGIKPNVR